MLEGELLQLAYDLFVQRATKEGISHQQSMLYEKKRGCVMLSCSLGEVGDDHTQILVTVGGRSHLH